MVLYENVNEGIIVQVKQHTKPHVYQDPTLPE
jgi:hypothetical protein